MASDTHSKTTSAALSAAIANQYDTDAGTLFYKTIMGGTDSGIHYGLIHPVSLDANGAVVHVASSSATHDEAETSQVAETQQDKAAMLAEASVNAVHLLGDLVCYYLQRPSAPSSTASVADNVKQILDLGSGLGQSALLNCRRFPNCHVAGLNLLPRQNEQATKAAAECGLGKRFTAVQGDFDKDDAFPDDWTESFDVVWSQETFCHSRNQEALLRQVARVLRPGGLLVWSDLMAAEGTSPEQLKSFTERNCTVRLARVSDYRNWLSAPLSPQTLESTAASGTVSKLPPLETPPESMTEEEKLDFKRTQRLHRNAFQLSRDRQRAERKTNDVAGPGSHSIESERTRGASAHSLRLLTWHDFTKPHLLAFVKLMLHQMNSRWRDLLAGGVALSYLEGFRGALQQRVRDIEAGVFVWGMFVARKEE